MSRTNREEINAILNYKPFERVPVMHFGFWSETLEKWAKEGHVSLAEAKDGAFDGSENNRIVSRRLGFDDNFFVCAGLIGDWYKYPLYPAFETKIIEDCGDDGRKKLDEEGVIVLQKDGATSIPSEIDHTLKDLESWTKFYLPKLKVDETRFDMKKLNEMTKDNETRETHTGVYCGSLYGKIRNYLGIVEISYLMVDDPDFLTMCIDSIAEACYEQTKIVLESGVKLDFGHFWEDICYKTGPLVSPQFFREKVGKHYRKISDLCEKHGINIMSVDCDGFVEDLVPIWLDNGINTMFPIEVGTWNYDFRTMREKFGKTLRGVGNMNKNVFSQDKKAVDNEIYRLQKLVDLGGFLPCPDHRIAPDSEWDLVKYYCDRMRKAF